MAEYSERKLAQAKLVKPKPKKRGRPPKKIVEVAITEEE
tara:strand:+ start:487 stop:603 length:117 start_codon:yes stop_codon:yes gene_type:complete